MVMDLALIDSHSNRASSYVFKRPYRWEEVPTFNARMNQAIDHGCNDGDVLYSELETVTSGGIIYRRSLLLRASENCLLLVS
jgi:hypothetical protein